MKTKNIFKALAFALLITTACNKTEVTIEKVHELPVTINVSRQGDDPATRASYNGSTKKLEFSTGDKLFVEGENYGGAGQFAGTLDWVSEGTFSGTITTKNSYSGTADELFAAASSTSYVYATLLPAGYETPGFLSITHNSGYNDFVYIDREKTFATSKATAVEQFSYERATTYSSGFALSPLNAILNFTISGLTPNASNVAVSFIDNWYRTISGTVNADASGNVRFAVGVAGQDLNNCSLTVGGNAITLVNSSKTLSAGHIYNITRSAAPVGPPSGAIDGLFTINASGDQVYFSQGNLKYSNGTWSFHTHQYDMCFTSDGDVSANYTSSGTFDLFGYGTSGYNDKYPYMTSTNRSDYYESDIAGTEYDWGVHNTVNGGTGWRTLTWPEWDYLLNTRTTTSGLRWHSGSVNNVLGIILLPDNWTNPYPSVIFNSLEDFTTDQWTNFLEPSGAVFLPAYGLRVGTDVMHEGSVIRSGYWTSSFYSSSYPYCVDIYASAPHQRYNQPVMAGNFVRLVRDVD